jgi:hypothetical protein
MVTMDTTKRRKNEQLRVDCESAEKKVWRLAAKRDGRPLAQWVRKMLNDAAAASGSADKKE